METNQPQIISIAQPKNSGVVDYVFKGALVVGAFFIGKKLINDWRKNKASDAAGNDPNVQIAMEIHQAIDGAGTAEKVLFDLASKITDWEAVNKSYRNLYNTNMTDDIKGDLSAKDFQRFMSIYNLGQKNSDGSPKVTKNKIVAGLLVVTEKQVYVRKSPVYMKVLTGIIKAGDPLNLIKNNAIALVPPSKILGISTGKYSDDFKSDSPTRFIEVTMNMMDSKTKKITQIKVWVASSQIKTEVKTKDQIIKINSNDLIILSSTKYNEALGCAPIHKQVVKTLNPNVGVYDLNFELVAIVKNPNTILGTKIGEITNGGNHFITYQTITGTIRNSKFDQLTWEK